MEFKRIYILIAIILTFTDFSNLSAQNKYANLSGMSYLSPGSVVVSELQQSVEFWAFKETWSDAGTEVMLSCMFSGGWEFSLDQNNIYLKVYLDNSLKTISYPVSGLTDGWHHFAFSFDGNYLRFYIDGYQRGSIFDFRSAISSPAYSTWLTIGSAAYLNGAGTSFFWGNVDEVKIWNKALNVKDLRDWIHRHMTQNSRPAYIENLVLYYTFDDTDSQKDNSTTLNTQPDYSITQATDCHFLSGNLPVLEAGENLVNTRALWSAFGQGIFSEPSGGMNLGVRNYDEFETDENIVFGHNGESGIFTEGTTDGVDLQSLREWQLIASHDTENPTFRFQLFDAAAGGLYYDCIPVYNYKLMFRTGVDDTFKIISEAAEIEGNLVYFRDVDVQDGFYAIARDNDLPTVISNMEVTDITTKSAVFGGIIGCDGGAQVTSYGLCWSTEQNSDLSDNVQHCGEGTGTFSAMVDSLEPGVLYYIRPFATNSEGTAYGDELAFQTNKMYQSLSFPAIPRKVYGDPEFDPGAVATSGLNVTYTISNDAVAEITAEGLIRIKNIGSTTVWAYQPGNTNYSPTTYKKQVLTVEKGKLIVSAHDKIIHYGDSMPELTYSIVGFAYDEDTSILDSLPVIFTDAGNLCNAGTYPIKVTGGKSDTYNFTYEQGTLNVEKAEAIVSAGDYRITYGDTLPDLSYEITGLLHGDTDSVFISQPELSCSADSNSGAGVYAIELKNALADNYDIHYNNGQLYISKADLTIRVLDDSVYYGDSIPIFQYETEGFVNHETEQALRINPVLTTAAVQFSPSGNYKINAQGASAVNYNISYMSGMLTILKQPLTVLAENKTKVYGSEMPELSYTTGGKLENDPNSVFTVEPDLRTEATRESSVGMYSIIVGAAGSDNYDLSYESGTLEVLKATPEIVQMPVTNPVSKGDSLCSSGFMGGDFSTGGNLIFTDPDYQPENDGEEVDVAFIPDDTVNFNAINFKVAVMMDQATKLVSTHNASFTVYPNPVQEQLIVRGVKSGTELKIYALNGQLQSCHIWFSKGIDVSDLPKGIYVIQAGIQHCKFVKL